MKARDPWFNTKLTPAKVRKFRENLYHFYSRFCHSGCHERVLNFKSIFELLERKPFDKGN